MGRVPRCDTTKLKRGPWTPEEDEILRRYISSHGPGNWIALPKLAGLRRCGKSCRLRWVNYLRLDVESSGCSQLGRRKHCSKSSTAAETSNSVSATPISSYSSSGYGQSVNSNFWRNMLNGSLQNLRAQQPNLEEQQRNLEGESRLDGEWGYIYDNISYNNNNNKKEKKKNLCSSSSAVNSASDLSEALSAVSAALGLSWSSNSGEGPGEHVDAGQNRDNELPSFVNPSLTSKSDGDDRVLSSKGDGDDTISLDCYLNEETCQVESNVPKLGMFFLSEEQAYNFYKTYAEETGFSVRKGKVQRLASGTIRKRYFFCSSQGFRTQSKKRTKYQRKETRTGCDAMIQFTVQNGKWVISKFSPDHNHDLEFQGHVVESCTGTSEGQQVQHGPEEAGIAKEASSEERAERLVRSCSSFLSKKTTNSLKSDDAQSLINCFRQLKLEDPSFFYTIQLDVEGHMTNFFWRDGRSKIDYDYFGDVLIFDSTFRVDRYDMVCVPLLGINHHRQFVLFGCAFLLDQSIDSLVWLFEAFMDSMGRHQPKTVFTDESLEVADAIKMVLPESKHSIGLWYISQSATKHLSLYYEKPGFASLFTKCISSCRTNEEFCLMWNFLLENYNLHGNTWLNNLHMSREKWLPIFGKNFFSAGIQSTEFTDKISNIFPNLNSEGVSLCKIVQEYMATAEQWRREELSEDFCSNASTPELIFKNSDMEKQAATTYTHTMFQVFQEQLPGCMEKQAATTYTHTMFKVFQEQLLGCMSAALEEISGNESFMAFKVTEANHEESIVGFSWSAALCVTCSCRKYESVGILCVHALKVLNSRNIFHIPPQYILKRWTRASQDRILEGKTEHDILDDRRPRPSSLLLRKLMNKALNVITRSMAVEDGEKIAEEYLEMAMKRVEDLLKQQDNIR